MVREKWKQTVAQNVIFEKNGVREYLEVQNTVQLEALMHANIRLSVSREQSGMFINSIGDRVDSWSEAQKHKPNRQVVQEEELKHLLVEKEI